MMIRVGFSKPKGKFFPIFSFLIRYGETFEEWVYTGEWNLQQFSHAYVQWYADKFDEMLVYESSGKSVHFLGSKAAKKKLKPVEIYEFETNDIAKNEMIKRCMNYAGTEYGSMNVVGLFMVKIMGVIHYSITGKKKRFQNPFADGDETQPCLETVGYLLEPHLKTELHNLENWGVRQLRDFVRDIPGVIRIR